MAQAVAALYEPSDIIEVRRLKSGVRGGRSTWHAASDLPGTVEALAAENAAGCNIYVGANPRRQHGAKGDDGVALARTVFVDFDHMTEEEARTRLTEAGLPPPTLLVNSGHGCHAYWRLDVPATDLSEWRRFQKDLIALVQSDPAIHNPERIMRLPGFLNHKPPPAPCLLVECERGRVYPWAELRRLVPHRNVTAKRVGAPAATGNVRAGAGDVAGAPDRWVNKAVQKVQAGEYRNDTGFRLALQLRDDRVEYHVAESAMRRYAELVGQGDHEYTVDEALESLRSAYYGRPAREPAVNPNCRGPNAGPDRAAPDPVAGPAAPNGAGERTGQRQALVGLADDAELFHDGEKAYATVGVGDHRENYAIQSTSFRRWLMARYWQTYRQSAGDQAVDEAVSCLQAKALYEGPRRTVAVRFAFHAGAVYLDLADENWRAVELRPEGWRVVSDPPVKFVRRRGMLPLPVPVRGGSVDELRPLVNAPNGATWRLMVAWLIGAFHPTGPYPALGINGEQGSAKSTMSRMLRRCIDPNVADVRAAPRDERDLVIAARNSHVVGLDNLSGIQPWLSDALCRLATGGGFATRQLYSDSEECVSSGARPILFNGIEEVATRPDLLERAIVLNLPPIGERQRWTEEELWAAYEKVRPRVLGALLDAVSTALRRLPEVRLERLPRMADFARWVVAAEPALGWPVGAFMAAYDGNRDAANEAAIEAAAIGPALIGLMYGRPRWQGTAKELLAELEAERHSDGRTRARPDWPKTPKGMADKLRRLAPVLRCVGIHVTSGGRTKHERLIVLEQAGAESSPASPASSNRSGSPKNCVCGGDAVTVGDDWPLPPGEEPSPDCHPEIRLFAPESGGGDGGDGGDALRPLTIGPAGVGREVVDL